jgi:CBS domain containing-hemolysin-like protein
MVKGVLNLRSQHIKGIIHPRVDMLTVPKEMSVASVLESVRESGYSRTPIYDGEIDNIVGIVIAKSVELSVKITMKMTSMMLKFSKIQSLCRKLEHSLYMVILTLKISM